MKSLITGLACLIVGCAVEEDPSMGPSPDRADYQCMVEPGDYPHAATVTSSDCLPEIVDALETITFPFEVELEPCDTQELEETADIGGCTANFLILVQTLSVEPYVIGVGVVSISECVPELAHLECIAEIDLVPTF